MRIQNKRDGVIRSNSEISRLIKGSGKGQYDDSCEHENESGDHIIRSGKEVVQNICPHISKNANTESVEKGSDSDQLPIQEDFQNKPYRINDDEHGRKRKSDTFADCHDHSTMWVISHDREFKQTDAHAHNKNSKQHDNESAPPNLILKFNHILRLLSIYNSIVSFEIR